MEKMKLYGTSKNGVEVLAAKKSLVLGLLQDYADSTETDIDNEIVQLVKDKLWPSV